MKKQFFGFILFCTIISFSKIETMEEPEHQKDIEQLSQDKLRFKKFQAFRWITPKHLDELLNDALLEDDKVMIFLINSFKLPIDEQFEALKLEFNEKFDEIIDSFVRLVMPKYPNLFKQEEFVGRNQLLDFAQRNIKQIQKANQDRSPIVIRIISSTGKEIGSYALEDQTLLLTSAQRFDDLTKEAKHYFKKLPE